MNRKAPPSRGATPTHMNDPSRGGGLPSRPPTNPSENRGPPPRAHNIKSVNFWNILLIQLELRHIHNSDFFLEGGGQRNISLKLKVFSSGGNCRSNSRFQMGKHGEFKNSSTKERCKTQKFPLLQ